MSRNEQKVVTRKRILDAAGRGFRKGGFGGIGVDALAKQAGVTSGAFYVHFSSKEAAFRESVVAGVVELREAVGALQAAHGEQWAARFIDLYLGEKRTCDLSESCALQSLLPEVGRADVHIKQAVQAELDALAVAVAGGLPGPSDAARLQRAWSLLSLLSGGVTLARAMQDEKASAAVAAAIRQSALALTGA